MSHAPTLNPDYVDDAGRPIFHPVEEPHHPEGHSTMLGFWMYLMSDCLIFAILFAVYAVLGGNYAAGPAPKDLFDLPLVALNTSMLLFSSITYGFAMLALYKGNKKAVLTWLGMTFLLGAGFIAMEINEFHILISEGYGPSRSGFLSAFFTLVGTHGLHVSAGLIWMAIMMYQVQKKGLTSTNKTRLSCLSLFWHFLDVVWICVFTVVYLMGTL